MLIQQFCFSVETPPHEQLHWSREIFLRFDNSCRALALLQQLCFSFGTPPNEQLHCSREHLTAFVLFILITCAAPATVSHLDHLEMCSCIAQKTMFLFLDNSC